MSVHNQFSCLAKTLDEDFVKPNCPLENSANNHLREHNNNIENHEPISEEMLRGCVVDGDELEYLLVNNKRLKEECINEIKGEVKQWRKK